MNILQCICDVLSNFGANVFVDAVFSLFSYYDLYYYNENNL